MAYEVSDTAAALPSGLSLVGNWSAEGPAEDTGTSELSATWAGAGTLASGTLPVGAVHTYTVTGLVVLTGTVDLNDLTCTPNGTGGVINEASVTNGVGGNDDDACVSIEPGEVTVEKSDGVVTQLADFSWQIDYTVVVRNDSGASTTYTLTDTPDLGNGFDGSGSWVDGTPVADTTINDGGSHSYKYRVIATVDPEVEDPELTCDPTEGGAFFNRASVAYPGGSDSDTGCGEPASPTVEKIGKGAVQDPDTGEWTLTYEVSVTNPSDAVGVAYRLVDVPEALPTGVTLVGDWSVTGPVKDPADAGEATLTADWNGDDQTEIATGTLPEGATHTYTVTGTVKVAASVPDAALNCEEGEDGSGGVVNGAEVSNGVGTDDDDDCITIDRPDVTVSKTVTDTKQLADGKWQITYDVVATNTSDVLVAVYSLSDTLNFGGDIVVDSASWTGPTSGDFDDVAAAQVLATNQVLAADGVDTYVVTAIATVDKDAWDGNTLTCQSGEAGPEAGGFLNTVILTTNGVDKPADDCSEPSLPLIEKTPLGAVQNQDDASQWFVSYLVRVTGGEHDTFYSLSDTPGFAAGITLGTGTASRGETVWEDIVSGVPFATDVELPSGAVHEYTITWLADLDDDFDPTDEELQCAENPQAGEGFFNSATLTVGDKDIDDDTCIPVEERVFPTVTKMETGTAQGMDGNWTITYDVVVNLAENEKNLAAEYSLTDTLNFGGGIDIVGASWVGPGGTGDDFAGTSATLATAKTIISGATHTYTVTVIAAVTPEAVEGETLNCVRGEEGPESGGFLNTVLMRSGGQDSGDFDCSEPDSPNVVKTGQAAVQDPETGEWTLTYDVVVSNPSDKVRVGYTLTDVPAGLPSGVTLVGDWSVTGPVMDPADAGEATLTAGWNGDDQTEVARGLLPVGASHTYTVTGKVKVAATVPDSDLICAGENGNAGGIVNATTVTNGVGTDNDDDCITIDRPDVTVSKTVTDTRQLVDGKWQITYDVVATNTSDELAAVYSLSDTLNFGGDIVVDSASWTGPTSGDFEGDSATLATDRVLAAAGTDTYVVTVLATVSAEAWNGETLVCEGGEEGATGGFLNTASLTANGIDTPAEDCSTPSLPAIQKSSHGAFQDPADASQWLVSYTITVTGGEHDTFYNLSDTPGFADGITLGTGTASRGDTVWEDIESGVPFATDIELPAGEVHVYTITWLADLANSFDPVEAGQCDEETGAGSGFFNLATLTVGDKDIDDDACIPVDERVYPTVEKTATSTTQGDDDNWTITYDVVVSLAENEKNLAAEYSLIDNLDFGEGISVVKATWVGPDDSSGTFSGDSATLATDRTIAAGGSETYTVTVVATVGDSAIENETYACVADEDGPSSGGFLNIAILRSADQESSDFDCTEPEPPLPDTDPKPTPKPTPKPGPELPRTGASVLLAGLLAIGAVGIGGGLLWSRRKTADVNSVDIASDE